MGSGPAGLACASDLAMRGHDVTIFEALHKPGGVLMYGIPELRLPKEIVNEEIQNLTKMAVEIRCNFVVGRTASVQELFDEWAATLGASPGAGPGPVLAALAIGEAEFALLAADEPMPVVRKTAEPEVRAPKRKSARKKKSRKKRKKRKPRS